MSIKIKDNVDLNELRKFGFKTGKELANEGIEWLQSSGYEYMHNWYHKFLMDEEEPNKIAYTYDDIPIIQISVRVGENFKNDIYISCSIEDTYHISGSELDLVTDTLFDLFNAGLVEKF